MTTDNLLTGETSWKKLLTVRTFPYDITGDAIRAITDEMERQGWHLVSLVKTITAKFEREVSDEPPAAEKQTRSLSPQEYSAEEEMRRQHGIPS